MKHPCAHTIEDLVPLGKAECTKCGLHIGKHKSENPKFILTQTLEMDNTCIKMVDKPPVINHFIHQCGHNCELLGPINCCNCIYQLSLKVKKHAYNTQKIYEPFNLCSKCQN